MFSIFDLALHTNVLAISRQGLPSPPKRICFPQLPMDAAMASFWRLSVLLGTPTLLTGFLFAGNGVMWSMSRGF